jgi:hypothetical protein
MLQSVQLTFQDPKTNEEKTFVLAPDPAFGKMIEEFRVS